MARVILLTFACLGWAWFELSGGSDFQPGQNGVTLVASVPKVTSDRIEPAVPQVARADTTGSALTSFGTPKTAKVILASAVRTPKPVIAPAVAQAPLMATPAVARDSIATEFAVLADYRQVTGSRVNLRGGPSTKFDVVTQLLRGEEVEILANQDDGWVKLRALDGSEIGWMSDSFLKAVN
ncbi:SH3 domain-containing protein [Pelagimonas varians]|uniref:Bacterial SH3 domain protein n=1 Tax=Pelagimonas varians TaxID=696760 RepID=A0A238KAN4_9RHOB|nr:SH3 domain-containing protein [Pelagimonas varians]PYG31239.1 SH3 domain-containing protein [Pelagimonas varians]SMX39928.1 Bacterial SH3 domain protein [Pelagimonas varians]